MKKFLENSLINGHTPIILLLLFVPTFFIRYFFADAQIIAPDGLLYIKIAKSISSGNLQDITEFGFFNLYSFFIALFQMFLHNWEFSGKMVSVVFGSLTMVPLFLLIRGMFNTKVAVVSTLFYMVHPRFVEYSSDVLREPTFWFFSITALWLAREGISRKKYLPFILSSLATGFAMFTRVEGALVFLIVILWILWSFLKDIKNRKKGIIYTCIFVFSLPILMSPSLLILKNKINRWELGHSIDKIPQLIHSNTQPSELEPGLLDKTSGQFHAFLDLSKRHRYTTFIMEIIYKFIKSFNVALFFLFLCGIYKRKYIAYTKSDAMIFIWFSVMFLALFLYLTKVYYISTRHGLLMVIPVLAWAGVGFFEIRERMRGWLSDVKLLQNHPRLDTVLLFVLILIVLVPQTVSSYRSDKVELKKAGIVLKNMGFSQSVFIVQPSLSRVAFYADAEPVQLPKEIDYDRIRAFTSKNHAALFIIDDRTVDDFAPGLKKIIAQCMFKKLAIPEMEQYREYSFSIYQVK